MTEQELRVKVAELCGWRQSTYSKEGRARLGDYEVWVSPTGRIFDRYVEQGPEKENTYLPDYCNDLDACHKFEKLLTQKQRDKYAEELFSMLHNYFDNYAPVWHMAALQRCQAFVKTMETVK